MINTKPLFTSRHYKFIARVLARRKASSSFINIIMKELQKDNPRFNQDVFLDAIDEEIQQYLTTDNENNNQ